MALKRHVNALSIDRNSETTAESDETRARWLQKIGLQFDPFESIFSEGDDNLNRYWISTGGHLSSHLASVLVFGTPGSGKTAKRLRLQSDLLGQRQALLISIVLPPDFGLDVRTVAGEAFDVQMWGLYARAFARSVLLHCLQHRRELNQDVLDLVARLFDAYEPISRWRARLPEAMKTGEWADVFNRLGLSGAMPRISERDYQGSANALSTFVNGVSGVNVPTNPTDSSGAPPTAKRDNKQISWNDLRALARHLNIQTIIIQVDDFDADARRTPALIAQLASKFWKLRRVATDQCGPAVSVQLYLPSCARARVLRRIRRVPETYDITWTPLTLREMLQVRLNAASTDPGQTPDALLRVCGAHYTTETLIAQCSGSPRTLIASFDTALQSGKVAWEEELSHLMPRSTAPLPLKVDGQRPRAYVRDAHRIST